MSMIYVISVIKEAPAVASHYEKYGKKYYEKHKDKELARAKKRYVDVGKSEKSKLYYMEYRYGITLEQYDLMLAAQAGVCSICGNPPKDKRLDIDHCHDTNIIRGLLCNNCNRGLGHFKNNITFLWIRGNRPL